MEDSNTIDFWINALLRDSEMLSRSKQQLTNPLFSDIESQAFWAKSVAAWEEVVESDKHYIRSFAK